MQHRLDQLIELGVCAQFLRNVKTVISQRYHGDITIVPETGFEDYLKYHPSSIFRVAAISSY